ncbi:MAG: hypothetical protein P1U74_07080 [Legionellaceae bacterium]|nr:hypothetical protein [Legionellaceae bacterium]
MKIYRCIFLFCLFICPNIIFSSCFSDFKIGLINVGNNSCNLTRATILSGKLQLGTKIAEYIPADGRQVDINLKGNYWSKKTDILLEYNCGEGKDLNMRIWAGIQSRGYKKYKGYIRYYKRAGNKNVFVKTKKLCNSYWHKVDGGLKHGSTLILNIKN